MALYIGDQKCKLVLGGKVCNVIVYTPNAVIINGIKLLSSDDFILKDINGLYLTTKKEDE